MITTTTTIIIIKMPTSTTSTINTDSVIMFIRMMITFFACFLIFVLIFSGWRSYISVSFSVNQTVTTETTRDCWTLIIQNMFRDICNENSMNIKAIHSAVKNIYASKMLKMLMIYIRVDIHGKFRRGYFCRSKFIDRIFHVDKYSAPKLAFDMSNNVGPT